MDLGLPGFGVIQPCDDPLGCPGAVPWAELAQESTQSCEGCFQFLWSTYELNTFYLARNNNLFMAGIKGNTFEPVSGQTQYQNFAAG